MEFQNAFEVFGRKIVACTMSASLAELEPNATLLNTTKKNSEWGLMCYLLNVFDS